MKYVLLEKKDRIATITLNRPEKYNAFADNMREEIFAAVTEVSEDKSIRVVVITGAGKAFCVGGDVDEFVGGNSKALSDAATPTSERLTMGKVILAINQAEKPFIASVNGVAAGGGCNLALSCDIRLASDTARFGQVFVRRGAFPDWGGIYFLPRLVGYSKAAELLFSGGLLSAKEAFEIGMVNSVVTRENLDAETKKIAERIAKNAPIPIAFI
jgi:2-(1,2-epoxy-1,2-dihydrophenyl)acetyl-CoA isomerase